jgi:hypothetical protein
LCSPSKKATIKAKFHTNPHEQTEEQAFAEMKADSKRLADEQARAEMEADSKRLADEQARAEMAADSKRLAEEQARVMCIGDEDIMYTYKNRLDEEPVPSLT